MAHAVQLLQAMLPVWAGASNAMLVTQMCGQDEASMLSGTQAHARLYLHAS